MTPGSNVAKTAIQNAYSKPISIMSSEFKHLNGTVLAPGQTIQFQLTIPDGYGPFIKEFEGPGPEYKTYIMVSLVSEEFFEGFSHEPTL